MGGLVADAACMPVHWHYDVNELKEKLGEEGMKKPEFHVPQLTKYYSSKEFPGHYAVGQASVYGEQTIMLLEYLKESKGTFDSEGFAQFLFQWFQKYTGRLDHPTKEFLKKAEALREKDKDAKLFPNAGAEDTQTMFTFKVPVLAMSFGELEKDVYFKIIDEATRAHQNTDRVANFAHGYAMLLKTIAGGKSFSETVEELTSSAGIPDEAKEAMNWVWPKRGKVTLDESGWDPSLVDFSKELSNWLFDKYGGNEEHKAILSLTCNFPGAFMASMKIIGDTVETFSPEELKTEGFVFAVRRNIQYGGDNCGRSMIVGSVMSYLGCDVPESWLSKLTDKDNIIKLISDVSSA